MRSLAFNKGAGALIISAAILGCGVNQKNPLPPVVVEIPPANPVKGPDGPETEEPRIPTRMTLLLTGDLFLAYVSVPEGDSWRDMDGALSTFYYRRGDEWVNVPGCVKVFSCDVSAVKGSNPGHLVFKAAFTSEDGFFSTSEAEHQVR